MKTKTIQPRKQRKRLFSLSLHEKRKLLTATLDKPLRTKFQRRNLEVRKGDKVKVLTGKFKGVEGEIMNINLSESKVYVDKVVSKKRDGTEVIKAIPASNLMLIDIDIRDRKRQDVLERKVSKSVIEAEVEKEEDRLKKEEAARKAKEEEKKREEAEKKAEKETKDKETAAKDGKKVKKTKVSEKGITDKTKKDWIAEK